MKPNMHEHCICRLSVLNFERYFKVKNEYLKNIYMEQTTLHQLKANEM